MIGGSLAIAAIVGYAILKRGKQPEAETFVWVFEPNGLTEIVSPEKEDATHIEFKYGEPEIEQSVKHFHPFTPVGRPERIYMVPRGSDVAVNPERLFKDFQDVDDPEPLNQEATHWYRAARGRMEALAGAFSPKNVAFWVLIFLGVFAGYILGNVSPIPK